MMSDNPPALPGPNPANEPALMIGTLMSLAAAALALLLAFGVPLSDGQQAALLGVLAAAAPLVQMVWTRARVYSPASVAALVRRR